ncbi:MAG TPA: sll0787 family AIR synthase-like protein [Polyangiaceae bacterium]|nr:sll0787 family AIR synthase-like protein [Polyangiaceae bacterium]
MRLESGTLRGVVSDLQSRIELAFKKDVQLAARAFGRETHSANFASAQPIVNGDDAAALRDDGGYLLLAGEGMRAEFVAADPWFAGFCGVMTNVNDIAAMGGRPWAIVDVLFLGSGENERVLQGLAAASRAFGVPVVGGHTTRVHGPSMLAVAVVGRARRLISSGDARPGHVLLAAISLSGSFRGPGGNFNAATAAPSQALRAQLSLLPELAEAGLVAAGKDISMAGICGTALMMLEASGAGARIDLERIPAPAGVDALRWLTAFPSYGFVLAVEPRNVAAVCARFDAFGVACSPIGEVDDSRALVLSAADERYVYWDLREAALTGFGP